MIGRTLSHYEIVAELGAGGMGVVYRARDTLLERFVALKFLPAGAISDEDRRRRFLQEARAASALNHPHIITVHDVVQADGGDIAIVMELVNGASLAQRIAAGPLPVREALTIARQIADALAAAHAAGIVHRDLKPANVMLTDRGAKVLDFGIAKLDPLRGDGSAPTLTSAATALGMVLGTAEYMSPEQARGEPIDARSDIFSLGVVLYEMLSGESPFAAPSLTGVLHKLIYEDPPDLAGHGRELPPGSAAIVRRALAKDPAARFQSMAPIVAMLEDVLAGREAAGATAWRVPRPRRAVGRLWIAAAALVVTLTGAAWWAGLAPGRTPDPAAARLSPLVELPATPFEAYELGQSLLGRYDREGYLDRSIESFQRALALRPEYPAASAGLGMAYWRKYREERDRMLLAHAESHARQAVDLDPHLTVGRVALASVEIERGELASADSMLDETLARDPQSADALAAQAYLRLQQRRAADALSAIRRARSLRDGDWSLALMEGVILMTAGRHAEAIGPLEAARDLAPDSALALRNLGAAYHAVQRYAEATSAFQQALAIRPDPAVYNNLGTLFFFRGLYSQAADAFDKAVEMRPNDFRVWSSLGDAYRFMPDRKADAETAYARSLQLLEQQLTDAPTNPDLLTRRAAMIARRGDCAGALETAAPLRDLKLAPAERYRLATAYEICDARDEALAQVQQSIEAGFSLDQVNNDPELVRLRADARYHRFLAARDNPGPR